jgi:hypothetical protein
MVNEEPRKMVRASHQPDLFETPFISVLLEYLHWIVNTKIAVWAILSVSVGGCPSGPTYLAYHGGYGFFSPISHNLANLYEIKEAIEANNITKRSQLKEIKFSQMVSYPCAKGDKFQC